MAKKAVITERAHFFFSGRVQGVGFRFTAEQIAMDIGLVGWVKNLVDGRVELVCEGTRVQIDRFVEEINQSIVGRHIKKTACKWEAPQHAFTDFHIEYQL